MVFQFMRKKSIFFLALYKKVMFRHLFGELIFNIAQKFGFSWDTSISILRQVSNCNGAMLEIILYHKNTGTTESYELWTFCMWCSYLTHLAIRPKGLVGSVITSYARVSQFEPSHCHKNLWSKINLEHWIFLIFESTAIFFIFYLDFSFHWSLSHICNISKTSILSNVTFFNTCVASINTLNWTVRIL